MPSFYHIASSLHKSFLEPALAFFLTMLILAAELVGGFLSNSLALLSDAGHVLTDIFALGLAWFATAQAERPANASKTFGYHRVGILAAMVNAVTLIVIALVILWEAWSRFQHPEKVEPLVMFVSAGIGIAVNLFIGFGLRKEGDNLNARAAALHVFGDVGASVAVIVAGLVILLSGWYPVDPILSVGIAGLIAVGAWRILRETADILLEAVPKDINLADLPPSQSSSILRALETMLGEKYRIGHTAIQFESHDHQEAYCSVDGLYCSMENGRESQEDHDYQHAAAEAPPAQQKGGR
jgi:cobalt-zinc-cadmium efflux system protein